MSSSWPGALYISAWDLRRVLYQDCCSSLLPSSFLTPDLEEGPESAIPLCSNTGKDFLLPEKLWSLSKQTVISKLDEVVSHTQTSAVDRELPGHTDATSGNKNHPHPAPQVRTKQLEWISRSRKASQSPYHQSKCKYKTASRWQITSLFLRLSDHRNR